MPYDLNDPTQRLFPGDLWTRGDWGDPRLGSGPFGFGPTFPNTTARLAGYPGGGIGNDSQVAPAAFMSGPGPQLNGDTALFDPTIPDRNAPFSLAPDFPTPNEQMRSPDLLDRSEDSSPILQAQLSRGLGIALPGPGQAPAPPGPFDWQKQTEQAIMRLWNFLQRRGTVGSTGSGWDDECKTEIRRAREICTEAYANGWESDHDVGPYSKPDGSRWTPQDCMRGLISERCGGNPVDKR